LDEVKSIEIGEKHEVQGLKRKLEGGEGGGEPLASKKPKKE